MKRTQVYIDYETYRRALAMATQTGQTLSSLIRKSLRTNLVTKSKINPLVEIAKLAKKYPSPKNEPTDISSNLDKYLYGTNSR